MFGILLKESLVTLIDKKDQLFNFYQDSSNNILEFDILQFVVVVSHSKFARSVPIWCDVKEANILQEWYLVLKDN